MKNNTQKATPSFALAIVGIGDWLEKLLYFIGSLAILLFVSAVLADVVARELFKSIVWMQEIALLCYCWALFVGAAIGLRLGTHFTIDLLVGRFKGNARRAVELIDYIIISAFVIVMVYYGGEYAMRCLNRFSQPSGISMFYFTSSMFIGAISMLFFCVEHLVLFFCGTDVTECKELLKEGKK